MFGEDPRRPYRIVRTPYLAAKEAVDWRFAAQYTKGVARLQVGTVLDPTVVLDPG
jgi:hypothetical protein